MKKEKKQREYVYWSRLAATKMGAEYFKYDYFRRFLHHKVNQEYSLEQIFASMELDDMLEACLADLNTGRSRGNFLIKAAKLTSANVIEVEQYLKRHWREVLDHYRGQRKAAGNYYKKVLKNHKKVAAVDIGWAGSGAVVLQYLVKNE